MDLATFYEHFHLLADAPSGVQKLREMILQLAVQGKLVPQDPEDEPASKLLEKIKAERARLITEGKLKKSKPLPPIDPGEVPFEVPAGWEWAFFDSVASIQSNLVNPDKFPQLPHVAPDNIEKGTARLLPFRTIGEDGVRSSKHRFHAGQIIYSKIRPNLSKAVAIDFEGLCSADMYPLLSHIDRSYMLKFILSGEFLQQVVLGDNRVAMPKVNQEQLRSVAVAVPPLAEQHRIVAKVDELMALCDELEERQQQNEKVRIQANGAALDRLLNGTGADDFAHHWQRN
jgi:type I restriction enzyme, S subunit